MSMSAVAVDYITCYVMLCISTTTASDNFTVYTHF